MKSAEYNNDCFSDRFHVIDMNTKVAKPVLENADKEPGLDDIHAATSENPPKDERKYDSYCESAPEATHDEPWKL